MCMLAILQSFMCTMYINICLGNVVVSGQFYVSHICALAFLYSVSSSRYVICMVDINGCILGMFSTH